MTTDDAYGIIHAAHSLLESVPIDQCDDADSAAVLNALDALDPAVIGDNARPDVDGDSLASALAMLYETVHGLDWSDVPEVSDAEARAMSERLLAALEGLHKNDADPHHE